MTESETYSISLVSQGRHRFWTLTMRSEVLAATCTVDTRADNPLDGFQRKLDARRAQEIADYIDEGMGTIPSSIVLSAQKSAELVYDRSRRSITFKKTPASFLILDGQHRVFGFAKAKTSLRVPVVIYNNLSRAEECRLFIDINTKQRPVPNELLLDIKRLAEMENDDESLLRDVFDRFEADPQSPLLGMMTASTRARGKLSRVTFNAAVTAIASTIEQSDPEEVYIGLAAYLQAWVEYLRSTHQIDKITSPVLFKAVLLLFPDIAQRVVYRFGKKYTSTNFREILDPLFKQLSPGALPGNNKSHIALSESLQKKLRKQFTLAGG